MLCAGFDSAVNQRANGLRWPRGPRRYDLAIALEAVRLGPRRYVLTLDGVERTLDATIVSVANTPRYGGGKLVAPAAVVDDGRFEVCVVDTVSRLTLARLAPQLDRGRHVGHPAVTFHRAATVERRVDRPVYADGVPRTRLGANAVRPGGADRARAAGTVNQLLVTETTS